MDFDHHVGNDICFFRDSAILVTQASKSICPCKTDTFDHLVPIRVRCQFVPHQLQLGLVWGTWLSRAPFPVPRREGHLLRPR